MDENVKARQAERANLEPQPGKEGREPKDNAGRSRLQYINGRLEEIAAERTKLKEERKALKEKRRSEKGTPAPAA